MLRILILCLNVAMMAEGAFAATSEQKIGDSMTKAPWFQGTVDEAFAKARAEQKHVFLYWGAVWCPPCNYLKSQVFDHARFAEVMQPAVAVFIDGDSDRAQSYADKFNASGYPTVIIFDPEGKERLRLNSALDFKEFESVLRATFSETTSLREIVARVLAGNGSDRDLALISGTYWLGIDDKTYPEAAHIKDRLAVFELIPAANEDARSRIAAGLLESALSVAEKKELADTEKLLRGAAPKLFEALLSSDTSIHASRELIANYAKDLVAWRYPEPSKERTKMIGAWRAAAEKVSKRDGYLADVYIGAALAVVNLYKLEHPQATVPASLIDNVRKTVAAGDKSSVTEHQRIAAVYTAAYVLGEIEAFDDARKLLDKELRTTKVPWYFQSSYASVERKAGNKEKALYWAEQARLSVEGRASKLQWILNEIRMVDTVAPADKNEKLLKLFRIYFDHALSYSDGFAGRNATRMKSAAQVLKPLSGEKDFKALVEAYKGRCGASAAKADCSAYFASL